MKEKILKILKISGLDYLLKVGEPIKDFVICYIVVSFLIKHIIIGIKVSSILSKIYLLSMCFAAASVPLYFSMKWLKKLMVEVSIIERNKIKNGR